VALAAVSPRSRLATKNRAFWHIRIALPVWCGGSEVRFIFAATYHADF
jgi:hypothetical protein